MYLIFILLLRRSRWRLGIWTDSASHPGACNLVRYSCGLDWYWASENFRQMDGAGIVPRVSAFFELAARSV